MVAVRDEALSIEYYKYRKNGKKRHKKNCVTNDVSLLRVIHDIL